MLIEPQLSLLRPLRRKPRKPKQILKNRKRRLRPSRPRMRRRRRIIHQHLILTFKLNLPWMLRPTPDLLFQLKPLKSQEMPVKSKNWQPWRKLWKKPLKRPASKDKLWRVRDKLLPKRLLVLRPLKLWKLSKLNNSNNFWNNFNKKRSKDN